MMIDQWLKKATQKLEAAGIGTARLDCLVLLEDTTGKDRAWLLAHPETQLTKTQLQLLKRQLARRVKHEPLAFIRGKTEFYGREFKLNKDVLEPRPESETMIDLLKSLHKDGPCALVDVGTGSGAIGITAKLEFPDFEVIGTDIDPNCLKLAKQNARKYGVDLKFLQGDLLEPVKLLQKASGRTQNAIILANLPYVPDHYQINEAAMMEPRIAIFGGPDGLDLYRRLFEQIAELSSKPSHVLTESLPFQHKQLQKIARSKNYELRITDDFIQLFKSEKVDSE